jgi:hypothetical protein
MFDPNSRYYNLPTAVLTVLKWDGKSTEIRYVQRRFIPSTDGETLIQEHTFTESERLDNITARYLDDPTLFWRVCDTNLVLKPEELERIGRVIKITLPGF